MEKTIVLNNKMNLLYDDIYEYINVLNSYDKEIIICPSYIYLNLFLVNSNHKIGSQNVFYEDNGSYTGEISCSQLKNMDINYSIVGHYERKKYLKETNKIINKKIITCLNNNISPILCFGENNKNNFKKEIEQQLSEYLKDIDNIDFIYFAYEPEWLIGNQKDVDIDFINNNIKYIKDYLYQKYHKIPCILYGGGVNKNNIKSIINLENLDGVMIGEVSSSIKDLKDIIDELEK